MSRARFDKQQREKALREKAAAKRERRAAKADGGDPDADPAPTPNGVGASAEPDVLAELARLHERFEGGDVDFDEFEDRKRELLSQLDV